MAPFLQALRRNCDLLSAAICGTVPGVEHYFLCPHCGEQISMVLDSSVRKQAYVEDCEVCCNPIEISYTAENEELTGFAARVLG